MFKWNQLRNSSILSCVLTSAFSSRFMEKLAREVKFYTHQVSGGKKSSVSSWMLSSTEESSTIEDLERLFSATELEAMMTELMSAGHSEEPYQLMLFTQKLHVSFTA